jgi:hypothetical protein
MRRTHARAGAVGVCDVPSIHSSMPPGFNSFARSSGAHIGGAHAGAKKCAARSQRHAITLNIVISPPASVA